MISKQLEMHIKAFMFSIYICQCICVCAARQQYTSLWVLYYHQYTSIVLLTNPHMVFMWCSELIGWLMRWCNWSVSLCQLTVTKSTMNDWLITMCPHDCRWFYCMVELNNGLINNHLTLEVFPVAQISKSFPQLRCEIYSSLIHPSRH